MGEIGLCGKYLGYEIVTDLPPLGLKGIAFFWEIPFFHPLCPLLPPLLALSSPHSEAYFPALFRFLLSCVGV